MKYSDLFALLLITIVGLVAYKVYTHYTRAEPPPDASVNEDAGRTPDGDVSAASQPPIPAPPPPLEQTEPPPDLPKTTPDEEPRENRFQDASVFANRPTDIPRFRIVLPSGSVFSYMKMEIPDDWQTRNLPTTSQVYVMPYRDGAVHGVFAIKDGKCHGASAALYPGGKLCTLAYYKQGQLSGPVRLWAADHTRLLYAEYANGQRHGLLGFFANDEPHLVQTWKYGKVDQEYFVKYDGVDYTAISLSEISPGSDDGRQIAAYQERLDHLLAEIETTEKMIKKNITAWCRKEAERIKRERAAGQSAAKRDAITSRIGTRNAAKSAAWEQQLQHALRRW